VPARHGNSKIFCAPAQTAASLAHILDCKSFGQTRITLRASNSRTTRIFLHSSRSQAPIPQSEVDRRMGRLRPEIRPSTIACSASKPMKWSVERHRRIHTITRKEKWLRGLDSNQDSRLQRPMCYQLHHPGLAPKIVADNPRFCSRLAVACENLREKLPIASGDVCRFGVNLLRC
jgi:hypothetical protein